MATERERKPVTARLVKELGMTLKMIECLTVAPDVIHPGTYHPGTLTALQDRYLLYPRKACNSPGTTRTPLGEDVAHYLRVGEGPGLAQIQDCAPLSLDAFQKAMADARVAAKQRQERLAQVESDRLKAFEASEATRVMVEVQRAVIRGLSDSEDEIHIEFENGSAFARYKAALDVLGLSMSVLRGKSVGEIIVYL